MDAYDTQGTMIVPLIDAGRIPNSGMRSSVNPATLKDGEFERLVNLRFSSGTLKVRDGCKRVGSSPQANPASYCLATWGGKCNSTEYLISAWDFGSVARIYSSNLTTGAWTELSSASGPFGNTRMSIQGPWSFAVARNPWTGRESIVIQNSDNDPRVYDPGSTISASHKLAIHKDITIPGGSTAFTSAPYWPRWFNLQSGATISSSGANFSGAASGSSPDRSYVLTRNTTSDTNPTITLQNGVSLDLSECRQIILLAETTYRTWWFNVKVELLDSGGTAFTIWDPLGASSSLYSLTQVPNDPGTQRSWVAFGLDHVPTTNRTAINRIRFTWVGATPSQALAQTIHLVAGSGAVLGQSFHTVAYGNQTSGAESRGVVITQVRPKLVRELGGPVLNQLPIVNSQNLFYSYDLTYLNTSIGERDRGTDTLLVYRNEPGDEQTIYAFVGKIVIATYAGSWSFAAGAELEPLTYIDSAPAESKQLNVLSPDPFSLPMPIGRCMLNANGRLFIGSTPGISVLQPNNGSLWISDARNPFRWRRFASSEDSGTLIEFDGETPVALAHSTASTYGENTIWMVTDRRTYRLGGYTTSSLSLLRLAAPVGTSVSGSVIENGGSLYMFSNEKRVIRLGPNGLEYISDMCIESELNAAQLNHWNASAAYWDRRYYLGTDSAGTPSAVSKSVVGFESRSNEIGKEYGWFADAFGGGLSPQFFVSGLRKFYFVGSDNYLYEYEALGQTTDEAEPISSQVSTREWRVPGRSGFTVRSARCVSDQDAAGSVTYTVSYRPTGKTQTATSPLAAATSQAWVESPVFAGSGPGPFDGIAARMTADFDLPGGSEIFALDAICEQSDLAAESL